MAAAAAGAGFVLGYDPNFLTADDFRLPSFTLVDRPNGQGVGVQLLPFDNGQIVPFRRNDPQWIARYTPVLGRMNRLMRRDAMPQTAYHAKLAELEAHLEVINEQFGNIRARDAWGVGAVERLADEAYYAYGRALNLRDPYLSDLLLFRLINNRRVNLADYDDTIVRAAANRGLDRQKGAFRRSSVGEAVEMRPEDVELPHGENYDQQMRERAMTLVERAQRDQAAAGYDTGYPAPTLPQPRPAGGGGAGGAGGGAGGGADEVGMSGSGIPRSRGDEWHRGQNRRYA